MIEDDYQMEDDFIDLVEMRAGKNFFSQQAQLIIGDDWKEIGRDIVKTERPDLMSVFEAYL